MEYRILPHGGEQIRIIGIGSSVIGAQPEAEIIATGRCVYCKHCHPCPAGLDIALINKYYDLAMQGDNPAKEHYLTLEKRARSTGRPFWQGAVWCCRAALRI